MGSPLCEARGMTGLGKAWLVCSVAAIGWGCGKSQEQDTPQSAAGGAEAKQIAPVPPVDSPLAPGRATSRLTAASAAEMYFELQHAFNEAFGEGLGGDCEARKQRVEARLKLEETRRDALVAALQGDPELARGAAPTIRVPDKDTQRRFYDIEQRYAQIVVDGGRKSCGLDDSWTEFSMPIRSALAQHAPPSH